MDNKYSTFDLAFRESEGRLAIWYRTFGGLDFLVNPCALFDAILGDEGEKYFLVRDKERLWLGDRDILVRQTFDGTTFTWTISSLYVQERTTLIFHYDEYWAKVKNSIIQLYNVMSSGKETFYEGKMTLEHISRVYSQLKLTEMLLMPGMKRTSDVNVEDFKFSCPLEENKGKSWSIDVPYSIVIGNRIYERWFSDWSNDLDNIRHNIEDYVFRKECKFVLDFDTEEAIVELTYYPTLESTEQVAGGTAYHYKNFMKVVVRPGYYYDGAALIGICEPKQVIRQLYEGLLNVARCGYRYSKNKNDNDWSCSPMTFYNSIKSPIIEDYLSERKYDEDEIRIRQRIIRHVFTISPDYTDVLFEDEEKRCYGADCLEDDAKLNLHVDKGLVSELRKWQLEFSTKSDGVNSTMGTLDSMDWNRRGMVLAQRLRQQLPDDIDLWYGYPFEDEENRGKCPHLIYKDYNAIKVEEAEKKKLSFAKAALWLMAAKQTKK